MLVAQYLPEIDTSINFLGRAVNMGTNSRDLAAHRREKPSESQFPPTGYRLCILPANHIRIFDTIINKGYFPQTTCPGYRRATTAFTASARDLVTGEVGSSPLGDE